MFTIRMTTPYPKWPFDRQFPGRERVWNGCRFLFDDTVEGCDAWVVYEGMLQRQSASCPPENTLFIACEHEGVRSYLPRFLAQFHRVLTSQSTLRHRNIKRGLPGFPWHVGVRRGPQEEVSLDYDDFAGMPVPAKTKLLSMVCSSKRMTEAHRLRLKLAERLHHHFGERIDIYGASFKPLEDKWDAVAPYKYHVVVENGSVNDWWTEKLSDAYLGHSFPFYWGCPNLDQYFDSRCFRRISLHNIEDAIACIEEGIAERSYENSTGFLDAARTESLNKYNLFEVIAGCFSDRTKKQRQEITLAPEEEFLTLRKAVGRPIAAATLALRRFFPRIFNESKPL
jgi:hypothetical protein